MKMLHEIFIKTQVIDLKVTIRDVAAKAGVSVATVSRVLNDPELVGQDTKERVLQAIQELDFHPNAMARGLSTQKTNTIGLIVTGITGFFFNELYQGIERAARLQGMKVLLFDSEHSERRALDGFTFLQQHQVGGIIFTSRLVSDDYYAVISRLGIPVVLALTTTSTSLPLSAFKVDDVRACFDAVAYLVSRGHRKIGMISGPMDDEVAGVPRLLGFQAGLRHYHLPYSDNQVEYGNFRFEHGYDAMGRLLDRQPDNHLTAVLAASDEMAIGAIRCLNDRGLRVPEDISVMGYDDLQIARMVAPKLTTIAQPFDEIGEQAVNSLIDSIRGESKSPGGVYYLPHRIVERESVGTVPEL
jgi:LacI family transcriptional regulator